jgi:hypothetical protein
LRASLIEAGPYFLESIMGLIYEHWRPDTNECFYVGASCESTDERPYFYGRHNDDYDAVVAELSALGLLPVTKIIWDDLEDECTGTYEKIRIAYQKALLGKKLTNKARGGFGLNVDWSDEMREKQSVTISNYMTEFYRTEEGSKRKEYLREVMTLRSNEHMNEIGPENYAQLCRARTVAYYQTEEGIARAAEHSEFLLGYYQTDEGKKTLAQMSATKAAFFKTEEGILQAKKHGENQKQFYKTEEGKKVAAQIGDTKKAFYKTEEGISRAKIHSKFMTGKFVGSKSGTATISEETAQSILDFKGTHSAAAKAHGVSYDLAYFIRKRKTWTHLTPSSRTQVSR